MRYSYRQGPLLSAVFFCALFVPCQFEPCANAADPAAPATSRPSPGKRFGVFFGVGNYEFNDINLGLSEGGVSFDSEFAEVSARAMEKTMLTAGKLDNTRLFVNEHATRTQMEDAITRWLPAVSRPGDTVFIYFCGYGDVLSQRTNDGGRVDRWYLMPHEYVEAQHLAELEKYYAVGQLADDVRKRVEQLRALVKDAKDIDDINTLLARNVCVPDDVFKHWLKSLEGRQVVVILEAPYCGGFAARSKAVSSLGTFLPLSGRLGEFEPSEVAWLSACGPQKRIRGHRSWEDDWGEDRTVPAGIVERNFAGELGELTYYFIEHLLTSQGPATIESTYQHCADKMDAHVTWMNANLRCFKDDPLLSNPPQLVNQCTKPVLLKPHTSPASSGKTRRFGVFFGVGEYEFNEVAIDMKSELNLRSGKSNAYALEKMMITAGKLDDSRAYVNKHATRKQLEESITQWLPAVSKPGDTVFIYFFGHGGAIPVDKATKSSDGRCFLCPHEYVSAQMVRFMKQPEQRWYSSIPNVTERIERLAQLVKHAVDDDEADALLSREVGVPADVFGHWLRSLVGRQVVVILEACHSGGFNVVDKDYRPASSYLLGLTPRWRSNANEHSEVALLAACGSEEVAPAILYGGKLDGSTAKGIVEDEFCEVLSPYTYYLVEHLLSAAAPTTIEDAHAHCAKGTADFLNWYNSIFSKYNRRGFSATPRMFNNCKIPVLFKPPVQSTVALRMWQPIYNTLDVPGNPAAK